jgi:hypothetical protein
MGVREMSHNLIRTPYLMRIGYSTEIIPSASSMRLLLSGRAHKGALKGTHFSAGLILP